MPSKSNTPQGGQKITKSNGLLQVPNNPVIPFVIGDGTGNDVWHASELIFNAAVEKAYQGQRQIAWMEVFAGENAFNRFDSWLPKDTIDIYEEYLVGIIGPLSSPAGSGERSVYNALHKALDLYACQRPVRYYPGLPSPVKRPDYVDMVVFRENSEDIYTGIEFDFDTEDNRKFKQLLQENFPDNYAKIRFPDTAGFGVKPVSKEGAYRLVRAAIRYALKNKRRSVTLVHKGNIMKYTEGSFRGWGYEVAEAEFYEQVYTWNQWNQTVAEQGEEAANQEQDQALKSGKLLVKDVIADIVFQQTITRAREFDVIATMNMNGDYISDALSAQVGSINIAPQGNINYDSGHALFESTWGPETRIADLDRANPGSLILSGEMMFRYLGWDEAANLINKGMQGAIAAKSFTQDFYPLMDEADHLKTSEFATAVIQHMDD